MSAEQNNDPGSFHFLAAGFVKDLLAARVRTDPDFVVSPEMRKRWELDADETKSYTTERLLRCSLERFGKICDWPIVWDTSCSDPPTDEEIVSDVYCHVKDFINREALDNAIAAEKNGQPIDWENGFHWDKLDKIRERLDLLPHPRQSEEKSDLAAAIECHVTLSQMAAMVNRTKKTLERLRDNGKLSAPAVKGGTGRADEWRWSDVRPILQDEYNRQLPEIYPADRFNLR